MVYLFKYRSIQIKTKSSTSSSLALTANRANVACSNPKVYIGCLRRNLLFSNQQQLHSTSPTHFSFACILSSVEPPSPITMFKALSLLALLCVLSVHGDQSKVVRKQEDGRDYSDNRLIVGYVQRRLLELHAGTFHANPLHLVSTSISTHNLWIGSMLPIHALSERPWST